MQKIKSMTLRAILVYIILLAAHQQASAVQATTTHGVFFTKNKKDTTTIVANIQLSWRVQNTSIHFKKDEQGKYYADLICIIRLSNDTGIVKEEIFNIKTPSKATAKAAFEQIIADKYEYPAATGNYEIEMVLYEHEYKNELYQYTQTITTPAINRTIPILSDIQILDTFFASDANTIYNKNGFLDLPLTSNYIDEKRQQIHYTFQVCSPLQKATASNKFKIKSFISFKPFSAPLPLYQFEDSITNFSNDISTIHHSFNCNEIKSGNYYLNVVCTDEIDTVIDKKSIFFQRYNTNILIAKKEPAKTDTNTQALETNASSHVLDLTTTFVGKYNADQVRAILKMLLLICEPAEGASINGFLKKPDELYSKYFIYNFFEKRDKQNPDKAWKAYTERIKEVNRLFKGSGQSGYETDRGRIYIQYGKPNDRVIVNNESGALPYEIWQYYNTEKQGQEGVFLFYKPGRSLGDYQLLHSTLVGEKRNNNWRALLYNNSISGSGNLNSDSRAEQFIGNK